MITRRTLIKDGGTATAALVLLGPEAVTAAPGVAGYLRRSSYTALLGSTFTVDGTALKLVGIDDLDRAGLEGSDAAFMLTFAGAPGLEQGIHSFRHPQLGAFELFMVPGAPDYVVTVDHSVKVQGVRIPRGPRLKRLVRRVRATRRPYGVVRLDLHFNTDSVAEVLVRMRGRGRTLRGTGAVVERATRVLVQSASRPPRGAYELVVTVVRKDRSRTEENIRIRLR